MPDTLIPGTPTPDPQTLRLFYQPKDRLRLTIDGDRSYHTVKPAWAAPLSRPGRYLALLDGKGNAIVTLPGPRRPHAGSRLPPLKKNCGGAT